MTTKTKLYIAAGAFVIVAAIIPLARRNNDPSASQAGVVDRGSLVTQSDLDKSIRDDVRERPRRSSQRTGKKPPTLLSPRIFDPGALKPEELDGGTLNLMTPDQLLSLDLDPHNPPAGLHGSGGFLVSLQAAAWLAKGDLEKAIEVLKTPLAEPNNMAHLNAEELQRYESYRALGKDAIQRLAVGTRNDGEWKRYDWAFYSKLDPDARLATYEHWANQPMGNPINEQLAVIQWADELARQGDGKTALRIYGESLESEDKPLRYRQMIQEKIEAIQNKGKADH